MSKESPERTIVELLCTHPEAAMERIFLEYYSVVLLAIVRIVVQKQIAEDLAQDVMYDFWRNHEKIQINTSLKAYLKRAAVNKSLNFVRDNKMRWDNEEDLRSVKSVLPDGRQQLEQQELQRRVDLAIDALPAKCRLVFVLSRFEEMTYQEIADQLGISIKTVENQISRALRILRRELQTILPNSK